ncbi:MAG: substrate-binding domain-containing protein, partial [Gammaproteobacteria bacterium]|nr:substrate-binding domain-containing protein [Gammaproteobacteria bacterium]
LVADAVSLESSAAAFLQGRETEIILVTDLLCPTSLTLNALKRFQPFNQTTGVLIREEVLSGTEELLQSGKANLGIHSRIPPGCTGEVLIDVEFLPVSHPQHELQTLGRGLDIKDLARATQIFIRDTGTGGDQLNDDLNYSPQRWTVSSRETALEMLRHGFGFCWTPRHWIEEDLAAGRLCPLPLEPNEQRRIPLYLVFPSDKQIGPATRELAACIRRENAG